MCGPVVGSAPLIGLGPTVGIVVNTAFYLPLTLFLSRTRFTGHTRDGGVRRPRVGVLDSVRVLRQVSVDRTLVAMIALAGLSSFSVGAAMQTSMPVFARDLGAGGAGLTYGVLLLANGAGGVVGRIVLEATGGLVPDVRTALVSTGVYAVTTVVLAATSHLGPALVVLVVGGVAALASMSIGQTVVRLRAPAADRGRVVGVHGMSANGLCAGSGFTVGLAGSVVRLHVSLGLSAGVLFVATVLAGVLVLRGRSADLSGTQ